MKAINTFQTSLLGIFNHSHMLLVKNNSKVNENKPSG